MLDIIRKAAGEKEIRQKFYFTLMMLVIYRLGNNIPIPFIDSQAQPMLTAMLREP